jgi:hypothetical protein
MELFGIIHSFDTRPEKMIGYKKSIKDTYADK